MYTEADVPAYGFHFLGCAAGLPYQELDEPR